MELESHCALHDHQDRVSKLCRRGIMSPMKNLPRCPRRSLGDDRAAAAEGVAQVQGGGPRVSGHAALFIAVRTSCPRRMLLAELGCGSGVTCWRRLRDWQTASGWTQLHILLCLSQYESLRAALRSPLTRHFAGFCGLRGSGFEPR